MQPPIEILFTTGNPEFAMGKATSSRYILKLEREAYLEFSKKL